VINWLKNVKRDDEKLITQNVRRAAHVRKHGYSNPSELLQR
jgi:hypothetical protein